LFHRFTSIKKVRVLLKYLILYDITFLYSKQYFLENHTNIDTPLAKVRGFVAHSGN